MISLEAATRTCKVDTASAARLESDRFLNPHNVVCPNWTGKDLAGRQVSADSFYTKRAGCNSAADRVIVENMLRPQYSEFINLDVGEGLRGQIYANNMYYTDAGAIHKQMAFASKKLVISVVSLARVLIVKHHASTMVLVLTTLSQQRNTVSDRCTAK